jgi:acylphosphatase
VKVTRHLIVHGRVQGVGYRYAMSREAEKCSVTGWVRNRRDGTVEATIQGLPPAIDRIVAWARRGPPAAQVTSVEVDDATGDYVTFEQQPSV